jgi:predicted phosphodiesterase
MKLNILSDLHLSQGELALPSNDADVVVLAGDIARPAEAIAWATRFAKPVLYVPGNHEFYGGSNGPAQLEAQGTAARLRRRNAAHRNVGSWFHARTISSRRRRSAAHSDGRG